MAIRHPSPEAIFDPFFWRLEIWLPTPTTSRHYTCSGVLVLFVLDLAQYRLRYECSKQESLPQIPNPEHWPSRGPQHTGAQNAAPVLTSDRATPLPFIFEGANPEDCRMGGRGGTSPQQVPRLSLCSCMTLHILRWHSRRALHLAGS
jgi:hypothetical protein